VQFIVGMAYYYMNEYDLSIERFQTLTKLRPTDDAAHLSLATALAGAGRVDEAVAAANKAIELNPRSATAYFTLGGLHLAAKRFALASESFAAAIDRSPALWQTYRSWAEAEIGRGDYNKAAKLLTAHLDAIVQQTGETDESAKRRLEQVRAAAMGRSFVPLKPMTELSKPTRQRSSTAATSTTTTAPAVTAAPAVTQPSQP
jgi:tetratricopeptide (TPR) repeat protein